MIDFLGASAARANAMTGASLQDIRAAADPVSPFLAGLRQGTGFAGDLQALHSRAVDEEVRRQEYADRVAQKSAEMQLRQVAAQTHQMEAQAAIMRAEVERVRLEQQNALNGPEARRGEIILRHLLHNPVQREADGTLTYSAPDASGNLSRFENLPETDPRVADFVRRERAEADYQKARTEAAQARADEDRADAARRSDPPKTNLSVGADTLRSLILDQQEILERRRATPDEKAEAQKRIAAYQARLDDMIESVRPRGDASPGPKAPAGGEDGKPQNAEDEVSPFAPMIRTGSRALGFVLSDPIMTAAIRRSAVGVGMEQDQFTRAIQAAIGSEMMQEPGVDPNALLREILTVLNGDDPEEREALLQDLRRVR